MLRCRWVRSFQIKESPEGDWNYFLIQKFLNRLWAFQIKESPEGDWNPVSVASVVGGFSAFQIKESPEGDWNICRGLYQIIILLSN